MHAKKRALESFEGPLFYHRAQLQQIHQRDSIPSQWPTEDPPFTSFETKVRKKEPLKSFELKIDLCSKTSKRLNVSNEENNHDRELPVYP